MKAMLQRLFGTFTAEAEPVAEHEVYLANRWDSSTQHCPVEFTGTREECEAYIASNARQNCYNWAQRVRPTGELIEV